MLDNKLIHGLGISLRNPDDEFINLVKQYPNAVIHVINGICSPEQFEKLAEEIRGKLRWLYAYASLWHRSGSVLQFY